jgi:hypothetical protein
MLLGNLLGCPTCKALAAAASDDVRGVLVAVARAHSSPLLGDSATIQRFTARALHYYMEHAAEQNSEIGQADEVGGGSACGNDHGGRRSSSRRQWEGDKILKKVASFRREATEGEDKVKTDRSLSGLQRQRSGLQGSNSRDGSSMAAAAQAARDAVGDAAPDTEDIPPSPLMTREISRFSCASAMSRESEEVCGELDVMLALFGMLAKCSDPCTLAWIARGLRECLSLCHFSGDGVGLVLGREALKERRPVLLLKLVTHYSPWVNANGLQCLAFLSEINSKAARRTIYLSGVMFSVVDRGMRSLPCVTAVAAHVAVLLSQVRERDRERMCVCVCVCARALAVSGFMRVRAAAVCDGRRGPRGRAPVAG